MPGFLSQIISQMFGREEQPEELPDDGGLGDYVKQLAKELEQEEKSGGRTKVEATDVLSVQQGKRGSKTYLLDSSDFRQAIMAELRESVSPVIEGILKSRCGEKGTGYMTVKSLYVFHIHRADPVAEYNAAMDIVDDIGFRLLGDRYLKGDRQVSIPVAQVLPDEVFDLKGKFKFKKAKTSLDWVRETNTHGPAAIDWEKGEAKTAQGAPDWVADDHVTPADGSGEWEEQNHTSETEELGDWEKQEHAADKDDLGDWKTQKHAPREENLGDWETQDHISENEERGDWEAIKLKKKEEMQWQTMDRQPRKAAPAKPKAKQSRKQETKTERAWGDLSATNTPLPQKPQKPPKKVEKPSIKQKTTKPIRVRSSELKGLGTISLGFRPTWQAQREKIASFAAHPRRKQDGKQFEGESIYPKDNSPLKILKIDEAICQQAARHLMRTKQVEEKTIILPLHLSSLLVEHHLSPLKELRDLEEPLRKSLWIEILGLKSQGSANRLNSAITNHEDKFSYFGVRFTPERVNHSLLKRTRTKFLGYDFTSPSRKSRSTLPDILSMARTCRLESCTWGIENQDDLQVAIQEGSRFINGQALAKELRRPGRIISMPTDTLISQ